MLYSPLQSIGEEPRRPGMSTKCSHRYFIQAISPGSFFVRYEGYDHVFIAECMECGAWRRKTFKGRG